MWTIRQSAHVLAIAIGLVIVARGAPAVAEEATLTELGGAKTQGVIVVDASPAKVYTLVTDYENWPNVLTDIKRVDVKSGGRQEAKVWFDSRAMKHGVTVQFDNTKDSVINFRLVDGPRGARATGEYVLEEIDGGKRTKITATLYMNVVGAVGWLVRDKTIRKMRQKKLRTDLEDLARYFE